MSREILRTEEKALKINLDGTVYGSFAEIGAGQEVARWFFRVGAAAKTVAKTISAYDMTFSDSIYGSEKDGRYVVESRLDKMLKHEYELLIERLEAKRGDRTRFFVFANTVAAKSFKGSSECHGWMGLRFQTSPRGDFSDVVLHVRMLDLENLEQQEALGVFGVNLIYACNYVNSDLSTFLDALTDNIDGRVEIDTIRFRGPAFSTFDVRIASLLLVQKGLTKAVLFGSNGEILAPREVLYQRDILVLRGSFRPVTLCHLDMVRSAKEKFYLQNPDSLREHELALMELPLPLLIGQSGVEFSDFLSRVESLRLLGFTTFITNFSELWESTLFLRRYSQGPLAYILGIAHVPRLFDPTPYTSLDGGILEGLGKLLKGNTKVYVYPAKSLKVKPTRVDEGDLINLKNLSLGEEVGGILSLLQSSEKFVNLDNYNEESLCIYSTEILDLIERDEAGWEKFVPSQVAALVREKRLFGYRSRAS